MDTYSLAAAARLLGATPPRVRRAVDRLGLRVRQKASGVFQLTSRQLSELADHLGVVPPVGGLTRIEAQVMAALSRSPRGLASVRAVARRAGVSPTAAGRALESLSQHGLVAETDVMLARGRAENVHLYRAEVGSRAWAVLAPQLARVSLPRRTVPQARRVPASLLHLFWNTAPAQLDVTTSAPYIARRLITSNDPDGLAWGAANLPAEAWEHAAATRGLDPATRALAHNLARSAHVPA
jgi:predicted transcriptional regulator